MFSFITDFFLQVEMTVWASTVFGVWVDDSSAILIRTEITLPEIGGGGGGANVGTIGAPGRNDGPEIWVL